MKNPRWAACLVLSALAGCFGTDTGNPPVTATLSARSGEPRVVISPSVAEVVIDEGWVSIRDARYVLGSACDHASDSVVVDLAGDIVRGVPTRLPEGAICGLHVSPGPAAALPLGAPEAFRDHTLLVRGTRSDGSPFELVSGETTGIDIVSTTDDVVLAMDGHVLLAFDVARWLAGVDLDAIPLDMDGVARLGPGASSVGLGGSIALYRDVDRDGRVGPLEERAGPIAVSHAP